jgi:N-acetylmuramoyl-L-alanine amidase
MTNTKPDYFSKEFWELMQTYGKATIEFPKLRGISFAQWALETGYGRGNESRPNSDVLPRVHKNFGGMKYRPEMAPYATPVDYTDWQGKTDKYCHFGSYENFIKAYWKRFDVVSNYGGWRKHTDSPDAFIGFIGPIWAPADDGNEHYLAKVRSVFERLLKKGHLPGSP